MPPLVASKNPSIWEEAKLTSTSERNQDHTQGQEPVSDEDVNPLCEKELDCDFYHPLKVSCQSRLEITL